MTNNLIAQSPFTVSTFHNISVYWSPDGGEVNKKVLISYRKAGAQDWHEALSMDYYPINAGINETTEKRYDKADYRGSIVNLIPDQTYEIRLVLEGTQTSKIIHAKTWSEVFPIAQTIRVDSQNTGYHAEDLIGSADGYILLDGANTTIDITDNSEFCIFLENCEFVIVRGFTLAHSGLYGIQMAKCNHIIIENCDISGWGQEDIVGTGFGKDRQSAIFAPDHDAAHCVIQRNKIHHPRWNTNSWNELHDPNADPNEFENYHPEGPQGVALGYCDIGNNVIRYNEFYSDDAHCFNDVIGYGPNTGFNGSPGPDSDIYGNFISQGRDDGIEAEGGSVNVRIWDNYIERVLIAIGNAPVTIGPLYVWRNISGVGYKYDGEYNDYGGFLKMGFAGGIENMNGQMFIFNNTVLQPDGHGLGGLGTSFSDNRYIRHCVSRNNILQVRNASENSISIRSDLNDNIDNDFDYDLMNQSYPSGHEINGLTGTPTYSNLSFDFDTKTGDFTLDASSLGYDSGVVIPNFTDNYQGIGPDMGAQEHGYQPKIYGIHASQSDSPTEIDSPNLATSSIYPNPIRDSFYVDGKGVIKTIQIFSLTGVKMKTVENLGEGQMIDVSNFSSGVYIIEIETNSGKEWYKLVVE